MDWENIAVIVIVLGAVYIATRDIVKTAMSKSSSCGSGSCSCGSKKSAMSFIKNKES
ncbi:MAG TPA: FeoB-associated Cys-rich membrane protein [bacterium]